MFGRARHIHFVGIGGIGMCGLAELLHAEGLVVTGSDLSQGSTVARLRDLGIAVATGHDAAHVGAADVVVRSSAVPRDNPEIAGARRAGIPVIPRGELLAEVMRGRRGIAVGGSHGKTTTASLVAHVLEATGLDPTAVIGGRVVAKERPATGTRRGDGPLLVAEADESDGSFLALRPVIAVVTNVDPEHLDHYGAFEAVLEAFATFANQVPFYGRAVLGVDHEGVQAILPRVTRPTTCFGFAADADLRATEVESDASGMGFSVRRGSEPAIRARVDIPGRHNVLNALAALAVAQEVDLPLATAADALSGFRGVERRFETKGQASGVRVVDDYAHHPAEIRATLAAARGVHEGRVLVVFQPHRYSRTRDLFETFAAAFDDADLVFLTEIYAAGEEKIPGVESASLVDALRAHGHPGAHFAAELGEAARALAAEAQPGDLVLTLGAGDVHRVGPLLLERLRGEPAARTEAGGPVTRKGEAP